MTPVTGGQMVFGMHTGTPIRILRQVQTMEYQVCRVWTGGTLAWEQLAGEGPRAVESQNTCQIRRRDDTYVLCGSALTGATRGNSEASRQIHWPGARMHVNVARWRSVVSLGDRESW